MIKHKIYLPHQIIAVIFFIHLPLIFLPSINYEFAFVDAAHYFKWGDEKLINQYFRVQANTIVIAYLGWLASFIHPNIDMLIVIRMLSAFGILFLGAGIINIGQSLGRIDINKVIFLILLNPLLWVFSARATADFLPTAIGIYALSLLLTTNQSFLKALISGILLGLALVLKYHAILLFLIFLPYLWDCSKKRFNFKSFFIASLIAFSILTIYLVIVNIIFGFWFTPPFFQRIFTPSFYGLVNNLFLYSGFLVLLCAPVSLAYLEWKNISIKQCFFVISPFVFLYLIGYFGFEDKGELNLGPLDPFLNGPILSGLFVAISIFIFMPLIYEKKGLLNNLDLKLIAIILAILILSLTRPAQRYLLPIIPFYILLISQKVVLNKFVFRATIFVYLCINSFIAYSQWCTGTAAQNITNSIREAGLLSVTHPGAVGAHIGNQFPNMISGNYQYEVVQGFDSNAEIKEKTGVSFLSKSYSLMPVRPY